MMQNLVIEDIRILPTEGSEIILEITHKPYVIVVDPSVINTDDLRWEAIVRVRKNQWGRLGAVRDGIAIHNMDSLVTRESFLNLYTAQKRITDLFIKDHNPPDPDQNA